MATERTSRADPMLGRLFAGRFQIEQRIGTGGMGNIYRAVQVDMDRPVAVKLLHPDLGDDPEVLGRFDRELKATTRIEHPNSVRVYEHGKAEGQFYLVMELLDGKPLNHVIATDAPMKPSRVAAIGLQIAQALAAAHAEKIVHRDLKPENVMLVDRYGQKDFVKVLDFGLARINADDGETEDGPSLTQTGVRVGTPMYMAPEYVTHFVFDHRSDLYALGVMLFEMATGQTPFTGRPYEILEKKATLSAPRAAMVVPGVPPWLDDVIDALLERDPAKRPQSGIEVYHTLDRGRAMQLSLPGGDASPAPPITAVAPPLHPAASSLEVSGPAGQDITGRYSRAKMAQAQSQARPGGPTIEPPSNPPPLPDTPLPPSRVATQPDMPGESIADLPTDEAPTAHNLPRVDPPKARRTSTASRAPTEPDLAPRRSNAPLAAVGCFGLGVAGIAGVVAATIVFALLAIYAM